MPQLSPVPYQLTYKCTFPIASGSASLRQRLHQLLTPLLRLVLAVVSALPGSGAVREQALAFVDAHARTLTRLLHDAASPGIRCAALLGRWSSADGAVV